MGWVFLPSCTKALGGLPIEPTVSSTRLKGREGNFPGREREGSRLFAPSGTGLLGQCLEAYT